MADAAAAEQKGRFAAGVPGEERRGEDLDGGAPGRRRGRPPHTASAYTSYGFNLQQPAGSPTAAIFRTTLAARESLPRLPPTPRPPSATWRSAWTRPGKPAEAEPPPPPGRDPLFSGALGEDHPDTALSYSGRGQPGCTCRSWARPSRLHREGLGGPPGALGEDVHGRPPTATPTSASSTDQGEAGHAEAAFRQALAIRRKVLGEEPPRDLPPRTAASRLSSTPCRWLRRGRCSTGGGGRRPGGSGRIILATASAGTTWARTSRSQGGRRAGGGARPAGAGDYLVGAGGGSSPDRCCVRERGAHPGRGRAGGRGGCRRCAWRSTAVAGDGHPDTARGAFDNVALRAGIRGGRAAEAEDLLPQGSLSLLLGKAVPGPGSLARPSACAGPPLLLPARPRPAGRGRDRYREALAIAVKEHGEDHPQTARAYNNVAVRGPDPATWPGPRRSSARR